MMIYIIKIDLKQKQRNKIQQKDYIVNKYLKQKKELKIIHNQLNKEENKCFKSIYMRDKNTFNL